MHFVNGFEIANHGRLRSAAVSRFVKKVRAIATPSGIGDTLPTKQPTHSFVVDHRDTVDGILSKIAYLRSRTDLSGSVDIGGN